MKLINNFFLILIFYELCKEYFLKIIESFLFYSLLYFIDNILI